MAVLSVDQPLSALSREWLSDLRYLGRSDATIPKYLRKIGTFLAETGVEALDELIARDIKAYLAGLRDRGLADDTVHGFFATIKAFANWADRAGYTVEKAVLTMRSPQVAQKEREVYSTAR